MHYISFENSDPGPLVACLVKIARELFLYHSNYNKVKRNYLRSGFFSILSMFETRNSNRLQSVEEDSAVVGLRTETLDVYFYFPIYLAHFIFFLPLKFYFAS